MFTRGKIDVDAVVIKIVIISVLVWNRQSVALRGSALLGLPSRKLTLTLESMTIHLRAKTPWTIAILATEVSIQTVAAVCRIRRGRRFWHLDRSLLINFSALGSHRKAMNFQKNIHSTLQPNNNSFHVLWMQKWPSIKTKNPILIQKSKIPSPQTVKRSNMTFSACPSKTKPTTPLLTTMMLLTIAY